MRTIRFRDVLYAVAYHTGQDPLRGNFLTNEAIPIGDSISQWVRHFYDARDWPEWTRVVRAGVGATHVVPYEIPSFTFGPKEKLGKVLKVYLVDPATTTAPVEAPDWRLTNTGVHCGFKHGDNVWIKYIPPAPRFTAVAWNPEDTFSIDDVCYLPRTGEVYRSTFNNNKGHEPAPQNTDRDGLTFHANPPSGEIKTIAEPGQPGTPVQSQILDVYHIVSPFSLSSGSSFIEVHDEDGGIQGESNVNHSPGDTQVTIITNLANELDADPGMDGFTISLDTDNLVIRITGPSKFSIFNRAGWHDVYGIAHLDKVVQIQPYNEGVTASPPTPQQTTFTFTDDQAVEGAIYNLDIVDQEGVTHSLQYTALENDSVESIMAGLTLALGPAMEEDPFLQRVSFQIDNPGKQLSVYSTPLSIDIKIKLPGQPLWELVPFPIALFDPVVKGAVADKLKDWGQTQEGVLEEQQVPSEVETRALTFTQTPNVLTEQNPAKSVYKQ